MTSSDPDAAAPKPVGPYTPVVRAGDWLICSGQVGLRSGALVEGGIATQVTQAIANIKTLLSGEGSSLDAVGHLVEAEETNWIPRIRHLIRHGESAAFPPCDRFGFLERSMGKRMAVLDEFTSTRAEPARSRCAVTAGPGSRAPRPAARVPIDAAASSSGRYSMMGRARRRMRRRLTTTIDPSKSSAGVWVSTRSSSPSISASEDAPLRNRTMPGRLA